MFLGRFGIYVLPLVMFEQNISLSSSDVLTDKKEPFYLWRWGIGGGAGVSVYFTF